MDGPIAPTEGPPTNDETALNSEQLAPSAAAAAPSNTQLTPYCQIHTLDFQSVLWLTSTIGPRWTPEIPSDRFLHTIIIYKDPKTGADRRKVFHIPADPTKRCIEKVEAAVAKFAYDLQFMWRTFWKNYHKINGMCITLCDFREDTKADLDGLEQLKEKEMEESGETDFCG